MLATVRSALFIDSVVLDFQTSRPDEVCVILKDETGRECCRMATESPSFGQRVIWGGMGELPYGRYTLELLQGEETEQIVMIKRV